MINLLDQFLLKKKLCIRVISNIFRRYTFYVYYLQCMTDSNTWTHIFKNSYNRILIAFSCMLRQKWTTLVPGGLCLIFKWNISHHFLGKLLYKICIQYALYPWSVHHGTCAHILENLSEILVIFSPISDWKYTPFPTHFDS